MIPNDTIALVNMHNSLLEVSAAQAGSGDTPVYLSNGSSRKWGHPSLPQQCDALCSLGKADCNKKILLGNEPKIARTC